MQKHFRAKLLHTKYYRDIALTFADKPEHLKDDYPQIRAAITWLMTRGEQEASQYFLELIQATHTYHQRQSLNDDLVKYCERGLEVCERFGKNPGWLYLIRTQAYFALGEWKGAFADVRCAISVARQADTRTYAYSILELGRIQLNRSAYRAALNTLAQAEQLLTNLESWEGVAARREVAAYYHNKGDYQHALQLYMEIDRFEQAYLPTGRSEHTLFMLGVVYRKLGDYLKAKACLDQLRQHGETEKRYSTIATATHHLAWIYLDLSDVSESQRLGEYAKQLYLAINDIRGVSDAEEQLGAIDLVKGDLNSAKRYLRQSIATRYELGNRHGIASSLRRLGQCYLVEKHRIPGLWYLSRSLCLYLRLGMLSKARLSKLLAQRGTR